MPAPMKSVKNNYLRLSHFVYPLIMVSGIAMFSACSSEATGAADSAASQKGSVIIVREAKSEFPQKFVAAMRELQDKCIESRVEIARAQGWGYSPASDKTPDSEILKLNTKRIEEYFDGSKYAMVETATSHDAEKMDAVARDLSCKLLPVVKRIIKIEYDSCHSLEINYASKERIEQKLSGACKNLKPQVDSAQVGQARNIDGTQFQCKWNSEPNSANSNAELKVRHCTLLPTPVHAGTGRLLIAEQIAPDMVRMAAMPLAGTADLSLQALATTEKAVEIRVNEKIPAEKFSAPADSLNFPLTTVK